MDVLLTDDQFRRFVERAVDLQIEFGFVNPDDRDDEIELLLERYCKNKPDVRIV